MKSTAICDRLTFRFFDTLLNHLVVDIGRADSRISPGLKVRAADLKNIRVVKRDALDTGLDAASIDTVPMFGAIPTMQENLLFIMVSIDDKAEWFIFNGILSIRKRAIILVFKGGRL